MTQHSLFDSAIDRAFAEFDEAHPDVWLLFCRHADALLRAGRDHYSADAICHVIRFHHDTSAHGTEPFAINNNFPSRFARKWLALHPQHAGFFELRRLKEMV